MKFKLEKCKGCGRDIVWARGRLGTAIPLDPRPPVYRIETMENGIANATRANGADVEGPQHLVSHFATCPEASQFSGKSRR